MNTVTNVIDKDPKRAVGILIPPTLLSMRRQRGARSERLRIERKAEMKDIVPITCQLLMDGTCLHGNDSRLCAYDVYMFIRQSVVDDETNVFHTQSFLANRGATIDRASWLPDADIYIPVDCPGAATNIRNLSEDSYYMVFST